MADLTNIARPYALAAFNCAREKNDLAAWKEFLSVAKASAENKDIMKITSRPEMSTNAIKDLFHSILKSTLNQERENFLRLIAQNKRWMVLPAIANSFNAFCEQLEKISKVRVVTAVPASTDFQTKIIAALTKRIKRDVTLQCEVDPSILGGAVIHMGDNVIDGSIRGKLARLLESSLR